MQNIIATFVNKSIDVTELFHPIPWILFANLTRTPAHGEILQWQTLGKLLEVQMYTERVVK